MVSNRGVNYLPVNILNRYELFLVQNDKKPSCVVSLGADKPNYHKKLVRFTENNGLFIEVDENDKTLYFVSKNWEHVKELKEIWNDNGDKEKLIRKGELLGYPMKAVEAFAKYANNKERAKYLALCDSPYGGYILRVNHRTEDSRISKKWREFVKKTNPRLLQWVDKKIELHLQKPRR